MDANTGYDVYKSVWSFRAWFNDIPEQRVYSENIEKTKQRFPYSEICMDIKFIETTIFIKFLFDLSKPINIQWLKPFI